MSPHAYVRSAALRRPILWRAAATAGALAAAFATLGCVQPPPPVSAKAADAGARVAPAGYRPVLGTYRSARPVEPAPWIGVPKKEGAQ